MRSFRLAKIAAALCCLLAFTISPAGSPSAHAQALHATDSGQSLNPSEGLFTLANHTVAQVLDGRAARLTHYNPEQKLRLALAVKPPHMDEEEKFIQELTTKGSPNFHKFLSADEWNMRFGPSVEDEQKVVDWAESAGLTVTNRYANRLLVDVEAPVGVIEKAFGVTINNYQVGEEVDFANDRDPVLPAHLNGIVSAVLGLNSVQRYHRIGSSNLTKRGPDYAPGPVRADGPSSHGDGDPTKAPAYRAAMKKAAATEQAGTKASNPTPMDSFPLDNGVADPDNIQSSEGYDYNGLQALSHCCNVHNDAAGSPAVSSIALVGYGNFEISDTSTFFNNYGMAWNINSYYINGTAYPGQDDEAPLDVEYSGAMANSYGSYLDTAHIYEYEMPNNEYVTYADAFNQIVSDDFAKVVSTSYGWEENVGFSGSESTGTMHPIFNTMVGEGWTLIASAGDNGATDGCNAVTAVDYPASDSDFIAAGGTELLLDANGLYVSEAAWTGDGSCGSNHGGGGGGVSSLFSAPYWQSAVESPYYEFNGSGEWQVTGNTMRVMPDISLTANPDIMGEWYYDGGWQDEGGTSIVAPELAGFFAQENTYLNYIGNICGSAGTSACTPVGLANPFFYEAATGGPHLPFYDTTTGCNSNSITAANPSLMYYCGLTGFDLATGWGSANMMQLAWGINWELIPAYGNPSLSFSGPATSTWFNSDQTVSWTLSDAGSSGFPAPGVAGFTQGWDSIPADPYSEPHGGTGNSFYSGPEFPFASTGCLDLAGNGCGGGSGQGCHTVQVEGWDNQGRTTYGSYGPVCYDTVIPTISSSTNPTTNGSVWVNKSVKFTIAATDPGGSNASGIHATYYAIDTGSCYPGSLGACTLYTGPFTMSTQGQHYVYYFTEDNAGNYSTEPYAWVMIDTTAPVTTESVTGTVNGSVYDSAVLVTLSATDNLSGVANTYYELDGGSQTTYSAAFNVSALGSHTVKYWSVDAAGNTETAKTVTFAIHSLTTTALVATPNPSVIGQSVTLKATVAATLSGTPTGSVTFWNGATNLGSGTLSSGVATLATTALPAGALTLQASYVGAGNFIASNSTPFDQTVKENTTTTVTPSVNPGTYLQPVTFTATVTPSNSGTPTGTVSFYAGATLLGTGTLNSSYVATLTTSTLSPGVLNITGVYSGDSMNVTSTSAVVGETIVAASQTITFPAITGTQDALTSLTLSATSTSGLTVGFASTTPTICTVSGTTLSLLSSGTCTVQASQAGNADYKAATAVSQSFTVHHATQTITFASIPNQLVGTNVTLSATASSGLAVSFASITPAVCTVSGDTASVLTTGACSIEASQAGNSVYGPAAIVEHTFNGQGSQTITFPAVTATQYAASHLDFAATASSGLTVAYASTTPAVCTMSVNEATLLTSGTCTVVASQAGNTEWAAAPNVTQSFTVHHAGQTITFKLIPSQLVGTNLTIVATATSGLTVNLASTTPSVCTLAGDVASLIAYGTCTIDATQPGNATYSPATLYPRSFAVGVAQNITFPTIPGGQVAGTNLTLTATASSSLAVVYTSTTPAVCTISGSTAPLIGSGTCTIEASQPGNTQYAVAPIIKQSFTVHHATQTITFATIPAQVAGVPLTLTATASSGLAVSYTSLTTSVCTVSGSTATFITAGTCSIEAAQAGNADYSPAPIVEHTFTVAP